MRSERAEILCFGVFEVDLRSGELRKQGVRIKLQEQPFHVLTVLLRRPGEVVTREELRNQNWPADTFVDFDNSLNTAINKLREALGDSADNPRFIETLPRRGYRFVAQVTGRWNNKRDHYRCECSRAATQTKDRCDGGNCCAGSGSWRTALARPARAASHGEGHDRSWRFRQFDGRCSIRRNAPRRPLCPAPPVALPELIVRRRNPSNVADDGTTGKYEAHA